MYCVKCQRKTATYDENKFISKNGRPMIRGKCKICKRGKTQFISSAQAKKGGFVFTIPAALAADSALGSLAGGAASIANAVTKKKTADKMLQESKRHNKAMENRKGHGLFLKSTKGSGLFLKPYKQ